MKKLGLHEFTFDDKWKNQIEISATNLPESEELTSCSNHNMPFDTILVFIRHWKKLKTITISSPSDDPFDFHALNEECKKLGRATPVTIYLPEKEYSAAKWKAKNLNLEYVKISSSRLNY